MIQTLGGKKKNKTKLKKSFFLKEKLGFFIIIIIFCPHFNLQ